MNVFTKNIDAKIMVLDTNILLHDPHSVFAFEENLVVLPLKVIEDLDKFKSREATSELANNARTALSYLDSLRRLGQLFSGVKLPSGGTLVITSYERLLNAPAGSAHDLALTDAVNEDCVRRLAEVHASDNETLALTMLLTKKHSGKVILVTKDLSLRLRADALQLVVEDYKRQQVDVDTLYSGFRCVFVASSKFDELLPSDTPSLDTTADPASQPATPVRGGSGARVSFASPTAPPGDGDTDDNGGSTGDDADGAAASSADDDDDSNSDCSSGAEMPGEQQGRRRRRFVRDVPAPMRQFVLDIIAQESEDGDDAVLLVPNEFVLVYRVADDEMAGDASAHVRAGGKTSPEPSPQVAGGKMRRRLSMYMPQQKTRAPPKRADLILVFERRTPKRRLTGSEAYGVDRSVEDRSLSANLRYLRPQNGVCWNIEARSDGQRIALELLNDPRVKIVTLAGAAGSGKTLIALAAALHQTFCRREYARIIVTRPITPLGKDMGALPGSFEDKMTPWLRPVTDALEYLLPKRGGPKNGGTAHVNQFDLLADEGAAPLDKLDKVYAKMGYATTSTTGSKQASRSRRRGGQEPPPTLPPAEAEQPPKSHSAAAAARRRKREQQATEGRGRVFCHPIVNELSYEAALKRVDIEAIAYIRGRSIVDSFIIVDEAQNVSPHEIKTIVSRVGEGTKIVLCGDAYQVDSPFLSASTNGLSYAAERLKSSALSGHVTLQTSERSALAAVVAKLL